MRKKPRKIVQQNGSYSIIGEIDEDESHWISSHNLIPFGAPVDIFNDELEKGKSLESTAFEVAEMVEVDFYQTMKLRPVGKALRVQLYLDGRGHIY